MKRRLEITNFRSIEHAEVEFGPFTVIVGRNGSGKSNLADTLVFLREFLTDPAKAIEGRGGFGALKRRSGEGSDSLALDVSLIDTESDYERRWRLVLVGDDDAGFRISEELVEEGNADSRDWARRDAAGVVTGTMKYRLTTALAPNQSIAQVLDEDALWPVVGSRRRRFRPEPAKMRAPQTIGIFDYDHSLNEDASNIAAAVQAAQRGSNWRFIKDVMSRVVPNLVDIEVETALGRYSFLKFTQEAAGRRWECAAADMSDGALRTLALLLAAETADKYAVLVLEEPETAVHPGAARLLFEALKEASRRCSVVVTTHSPELLDAAASEEIIVCELVDGVTQVGPLAEPQRNVVRQGLFTLSELMRSEPLRIEGQDIRTLDPRLVDS